MVTNLLEGAPPGELMLSGRKEQLDLLALILTSGEPLAGEERPEADAAADLQVGGAGARRVAGNVAALTGAEGLRYMELDAASAPARNTAATLATLAREKAAAGAQTAKSALWSRVKRY